MENHTIIIIIIAASSHVCAQVSKAWRVHAAHATSAAAHAGNHLRRQRGLWIRSEHTIHAGRQKTARPLILRLLISHGSQVRGSLHNEMRRQILSESCANLQATRRKLSSYMRCLNSQRPWE